MGKPHPGGIPLNLVKEMALLWQFSPDTNPTETFHRPSASGSSQCAGYLGTWGHTNQGDQKQVALSPGLCHLPATKCKTHEVSPW